MQPGDSVEVARQPDGPAALRLLQPKDPYVALGFAVAHLLVKPAFARLHFGDWSRIVVGQINRGHYCFAMDEGSLGNAITADWFLL